MAPVIFHHAPAASGPGQRTWWLLAVAVSGFACSRAEGPGHAQGTSPDRVMDASVADAAEAGAGEVCGSPDAVPADLSDGIATGPALVVDPLQGIAVPIRDRAGNSGIDGLAVLTQSQLGGDGPVTTPAEFEVRDGKLCLKGTTVIVPLMRFADYWGAAITFALSVDAVRRAADAGAEEGAGPIIGFDWTVWNPAQASAVGLSFVVEGQDAELPCGGLPPLLRMQVLPSGGDPSTDLYCQDFRSLGSGQRVDVRFAEATRDCWEPGGRRIFAEPLPAGQGRGLETVTWLIPADESAPHPFDLCFTDIRIILEP